MEPYVTEAGEFFLITLNSLDIEGNLKSTHLNVSYAEWFLQTNDLVMVLSDIAHGNFLGLVDLINCNDTYVLNQRMGMLRPIGNKLSSGFAKAYINQNQKYFKLHGQGSSQQNLSKGDILKFELSLPSLPEQKKIADFLGAVD